MDDFQTLGTIGRGHDLEALQLEVDPDQLPDDLVVVHNKHPARRAWHNFESRSVPATASGFSPLPPPASDPPSPDQDTSPGKPVHEHPEGAGSVLPVAARNTTAADTPP
ncbi:hypothetical protein GCM10020295_25570 [Streptomyces cinereospinus]